MDSNWHEFALKTFFKMSMLRLDDFAIYDDYDHLYIRTYIDIGYFDDFRELSCSIGKDGSLKRAVLSEEGRKAYDLLELKSIYTEYLKHLDRVMSMYDYSRVSDVWRDEMNVESLICNEFSRKVKEWNDTHGKEEKIRFI